MTSAEQLNLNASNRTATKKDVAELRSNGIVPGIVYGHGQENKLIQVDHKELATLYTQSGESTLINLVLEGEAPIQVLIHALDRDPVTDAIQHVDLFAVNMEERITAEVSVHYVGVSAAVKDLSGTLVKNRDHITIKCLPGDLISDVELDLGVLETFDDAIHVGDVKFPDSIEVLDAADLTVATVAPPRTEAEIAALDEDITEVTEEEGTEEGEETEGEEKEETTEQS